MTTPPPAPAPGPAGRRWDDLVQRARDDRPAPIALAALLHATRTAAAAAAPVSFLTEFAALFASRRALGACAAATVACAVLAGWQTWSLWQELGPMAELAATTWGIGL